MKITPTNNQSFKAFHPVFKEDVSNEKLATKYLNHTTYFFRYGDLDEFLIEKPSVNDFSAMTDLSVNLDQHP